MRLQGNPPLPLREAREPGNRLDSPGGLRCQQQGSGLEEEDSSIGIHGPFHVLGAAEVGFDLQCPGCQSSGFLVRQIGWAAREGGTSSSRIPCPGTIRSCRSWLEGVRRIPPSAPPRGTRRISGEVLPSTSTTPSPRTAWISTWFESGWLGSLENIPPRPRARPSPQTQPPSGQILPGFREEGDKTRLRESKGWQRPGDKPCRGCLSRRSEGKETVPRRKSHCPRPRHWTAQP